MLSPSDLRHASLLAALALATTLLACGTTARCDVGAAARCYPGPAETRNVGVCREGATVCSSDGRVLACEGAVLPGAELCDGFDNDCDGEIDEGVTNACGGCGPLQPAPGEPCGTCGTVTCDGPETTECVETRENNCGACGVEDVKDLGLACDGENGCAGAWVCDAQGTGKACRAAQRNNCGVCGADDVSTVGASCSSDEGCNGTWTCSTSGIAAECSAPRKNACGVCGGTEITGLGERCNFNGGCGVKACNAAGDGVRCVQATEDADKDGVPDLCDICPFDSDSAQTNSDGDALGNACDNCPFVTNSDQADLDGDSIGDVCDSDRDGDNRSNGSDNCPEVANGDQRDHDLDGVGDVCDTCPAIADPAQEDSDGDGKGDRCSVVISEFAAEGVAGATCGGKGDEFVELYNPGPSALSIGGWKLQYRSGTSTTSSFSTIVTLPAGATIGSRRYFLIASGDSCTGYGGSPPADVVRENSSGAQIPLNISSDAGHLRLALPTVGGAIDDVNRIDVITWGAGAVNAGGGAPAVGANFALGQSYERKAHAGATAGSMGSGGVDALKGNAFDSDDSAGDFVIRNARGAQSSVSPMEP